MTLTDTELNILIGTYSPNAQGNNASINVKWVYAALCELRAIRTSRNPN